MSQMSADLENSFFINNSLIKFFILRNDAVGIEFLDCPGATSFSHLATLLIIRDKRDREFSHSFDVADLDQISSFAVNDDFRQSPGTGGDHRHLASHGFESSQSE